MKKLLQDIRLYIFTLPPLVVMYLFDPAVTNAVLFSLAAVVLIVGMTHAIRKVMFKSLDLQDSIDLAETTPMSAAILFLGVIIFFCTVLTCAVWWVRG